jgi:hypothetical protein
MDSSIFAWIESILAARVDVRRAGKIVKSLQDLTCKSRREWVSDGTTEF